MSVKVRLKILPQYFQAIVKGLKTVEGRLKKNDLVYLQKGDTIEFVSESSHTHAQVTYIKEYKSFKEMLLDQGVANCLPDLSDADEAAKVYHSFPGYREGEVQFGVLAIGIKNYGSGSGSSSS